MDDTWVDDYLDRIGAKRPVRTDHAALAELQERHLLSVPFENLDVHRGVGIPLTTGELIGKVVDRRRGGICYELNGAFATLLSALGYQVTLLPARVHGPDGRVGPPFDHMALRVDLDEPWLADVGFGKFARHPLRLADRGDQQDPAGVLRITEAEHGDLDITMDGTPQYRLESRPRELPDFEATFWYQRTSPDSHFTKSLVCSLPTEQGRVSLSGRQLIETVGADRRERTLESDEEVLAVYRDRFGIVLDTVPTVRTATA